MLIVTYKDAPASVEVKHNKILLTVRPNSTKTKKQEVLESWCREQLRDKASGMLKIWEKKLGVQTHRLIIQKMKTRWGSCSPDTRIVRLNLELVKKPPQYLEYIIVHELMHLIEPTHNRRFTELMSTYMPKWREFREELITIFELTMASPAYFFIHILPLLVLSKVQVFTWCGNNRLAIGELHTKKRRQNKKDGLGSIY